MDDECWRSIFQYLTNYDKTKLTLVSRRWRYVVVRYGSFTTIDYRSICRSPFNMYDFPLFKNSFKMSEILNDGRLIYYHIKNGLELPIYHEGYKFPLIKTFMDDAVFAENHEILKQLEFPNLEVLTLRTEGDHPSFKPNEVPLPQISFDKLIRLEVGRLLPEYIPLLAKMVNLVYLTTRMKLSLFDQYVPPSLKCLDLHHSGDSSQNRSSVEFNIDSRIFQQIETFKVYPSDYFMCRKEWNIPKLKNLYLFGSTYNNRKDETYKKYKFLQNIEELNILYASDSEFLSYGLGHLKKIKNLIIDHPWNLEEIRNLSPQKVNNVFLLNCWRVDEFVFFHQRGFNVYAFLTDHTYTYTPKGVSPPSHYNTPENRKKFDSYKKDWEITNRFW